ncbi:MAG: glycosyltransferase [Actinobacteria bacterium]|nr:glycosyltransferase [Actinomycetota bacterium]
MYDRFDAVVVHSAHGRGRLVDDLGLDPARVHVIPHGAFTHLAAEGRPLPEELGRVERPVVLCFGLIRPYKGVDVLVDAWSGDWDAELWIVGMPRIDITDARTRAAVNVRWVSRFVADDELPAFFRRADLVVLPYLEADQSGVLATALAFGKPLLLSDVGGFAELGVGRLVPPGDRAALRAGLAELIGDEAARGRLGAGARAAAAGPLAWGAVARRTLGLYASLVN